MCWAPPTPRPAGSAEISAHTDYIGVRSDQRQRGIGEFLLKKIWLAALRRGFTVASLGTDINNRSNAHLLYRRLGYVAVEHQSAYRIDSETGREMTRVRKLSRGAYRDLANCDRTFGRPSTRSPQPMSSGNATAPSRMSRSACSTRPASAPCEFPMIRDGFGASLEQTFLLLADLGEADANVSHIWRNHLAFVEDRLNAP